MALIEQYLPNISDPMYSVHQSLMWFLWLNWRKSTFYPVTAPNDSKCWPIVTSSIQKPVANNCDVTMTDCSRVVAMDAFLAQWCWGQWFYYVSAFRRRRHYVFGLSVRPSVRPKPEIPSFDLYMGPLVHPINRNRFTACPSVHPSVRRGFQAFARECMEGLAWNFTCWCMLTIFRTDKFMAVVCWFLAGTKQLYEWYFLSVRLSICLSICHTFLTMFPSSYHHEIFRSCHHGPG